MNQLTTVALLALTLILPTAAAQETKRFPELRAEQLTPEQKKWAESIAAAAQRQIHELSVSRAYPQPGTRGTPAGMSDYERWNTQQPARLSEFAILITARQWSSQWIWRGHYTLAIKGGLDSKVALDLAAGRRPEGMKEDERILDDLAMQIYRDKAVTDTMYDKAQIQFGERGILDLIGIMGYYDTVAMILIAARAIPPHDDAIPQLKPLATK